MIRSLGPHAVSVIAGATLGLLGAVLFAVAHAVLISPVWSSLLGGLPISLAVGGACGLAFARIWATARRRVRISDGARFGLLLWISLLPVTLVAAGLRWAGMHDAESSLEVLGLVIVSAASGAGLGYAVNQRRGDAAILSVATVLLVLAMGGPIAVGQSATGVGLYVAFAGLLPLCGSLLPLTMTRLAAIASRRDVVCAESGDSGRKAAPN